MMASIVANHVNNSRYFHIKCENSLYEKDQTKCTTSRKFIFIIRPQKYVHNIVYTWRDKENIPNIHKGIMRKKRSTGLK